MRCARSGATPPGVPVWTDRTAGVARVGAALDGLARHHPGLPIALVGLGAGGAIALEVAADRPSSAPAVLAVAAPTPRSVGPLGAGRPLRVLLDPAEGERAAKLGEWAAGAPGRLRVETVAGLGHALPTDLATRVEALVAGPVVADRARAAGTQM